MTIAPDIPISPTVAQAAETLDHNHYRHHPGRGRTPHITNPLYVQRDVTYLDIHPDSHVLEIGTGSGYSGALLARLTGRNGRVTSLDIDPYLTRWANVIHTDDHTTNIVCHAADGTTGYPPAAPYDRIGAWCAPPHLPAAWVNQCAPTARIVSTLPVAPVAELCALTVLTVTNGNPTVEFLDTGSYIDATPAPRADLSLPGHLVDWEIRHPTPHWISIGWRDQDDWLHTGARTTLDRLTDPGHTEAAPDIKWGALAVWAASSHNEALTTVGLGSGTLAVGHSTPDSVAVLTEDGQILAEHPASPSLLALREWIAQYHERHPKISDYLPELTTTAGGWSLRLHRAS